MIKWPTDLISDMARRRAVVFLGSGISMHSANAAGQRPKSWEEFLTNAQGQLTGSKNIVKKIIKRFDYLTACEIIKAELGSDAFSTLLITEYLNPGFLHATIHEEIFRLDSRIVATPNFDKIYETYANHAAHSSIRVKCHYDTDVAEAIRRSDRLILKIHGTIDSPTKMIFTRNEYAEARSKYSAFYRILEALAITHTFLFVGCGVNDPDLRLLLEDHFFRHVSTRPHIMVLPSKEISTQEEVVLKKSMNLQVLTYDKSSGHIKLIEAIKQLADLVEVERRVLATSSNW